MGRSLCRAPRAADRASRRLRVLVLTRTTALGGVERLLMNTLPYLDTTHFDYSFAALDGHGPLAEACTAHGHRFLALARGRGSAARALWSLRRVVQRERIDLIHAHLPVPGALARLAARGTGVGVVYTEHTTQDVYRAPARWLNAASYGWQQKVIAVSDRVRASAEAHIRNAARGTIDVVYNGVDLAQLEREAARPPDPPPPTTEGATRVLVPANLSAVKGHDVLFDALELLEPTAGPFDIWLAGEGPRRAPLEARARALRFRGRIEFLGTRRDIFALMRRADIVALPSHREGAPLAILEALALGRPVLATAVGGIPELIEDGRTGLLVAPSDAAAFASALDTLSNAPELRGRLAAAARDDAQARFDVRGHVEALEQIYRRVGSRRTGAERQASLSASPM